MKHVKPAHVFGPRAGFYASSPAHKDPGVLADVVRFCEPQPDWRALDVATGTGHTAFALAAHVASVAGVDITSEMLCEAKQLQKEAGVDNVRFLLADVHELPFEDASFDLAAARRAPPSLRQYLGGLGGDTLRAPAWGKVGCG